MKPKRFRFRSTPLFGSPLCYGAPVFAGLVVVLCGLDADAKDILRPNASAAGTAPTAAGGGGALTRAATEAARANTRDILKRNGETLNAMRAMQAAARAAAQNGPDNLAPNLPAVPNGLRPGGLNPAADAATNPASWSGAGQPVETVSGENVNVTIRQTTQQALLQWQTLNVGKKTTLTFDQSAAGANAAQWIAFNKVNDPTGNPTQILGNIKADGQVYLINRNGVIFGGSSQVNARGLTVSSLPINDNLVGRGLLNNPDAQFLFTGLSLPAGINGTPAFTPDPPPASGRYGDVVVQKGAILNSPTDSANVGGRITLVGPNVRNEGTIITPDGQAILAAGLQVGFDGHSSADPTLRGLDVFVGAVSDPVAGLYTGTTTQNGVVEAPRGAITIAGRDIRQNGALASTTSVSFNGRIDIQANYNAVSNRATATSSGALFLFRNAGAVALGASSTIGILPEYGSADTTIGTELALRSQINVNGRTIHMGENSTLAAPNALVTLAAGSWNFISGTTPQSSFIRSGGQVYLDRGAGIDVAGSIAVPVPVSQNIISVDLRSAELANSPLQRDGVLRNASIQVDIRKSGDGWIGTPLADVSGFANLIQRSVGQLTVAGGSVTITAGDSVVTQAGSIIDVSGGSTLFEGGVVQTTKLISAGRLVDIENASPDLVYDGIFDGTFTQASSKFGVTNIFSGVIAPSGSRRETTYTEGAGGGNISISAPTMALDGTLSGITVSGERQRKAPTSKSSLSLSFTAVDTTYPTLPVFSPTPPRITFTQAPSQTPAGPFAVDSNGNPVALADERIRQIQLSSNLMSGSGFGILEVDNQDGDIVVPENTTIEAPVGGRIVFAASNIQIGGSVIAPQGDISFSAYNLSRDILNRLNNSTGNSLPAAAPDRGIFTLGSRGLVSAAGLLVNDRVTPSSAFSAPLLSTIGSITINSYSAQLSSGGRLDVSGGVHATERGKITYGSGGSLAINAGRDLSEPAVLGGKLSLQSTLAGYSGTTAGSLAIEAPAIQIGGVSTNPGVTHLQEAFFNQGGFAKFSLSGIGLAGGGGQFVTGLLVDSTTRLRPVATSWNACLTAGGLEIHQVLREEGLRTPASLTLRAFGAVDTFAGNQLGRGDVIMEAGAVIETDAKGGVAFEGETVTLMGSVISPGGTVSAAGAARFPSIDPNALLPTLLVGSSARISTAGKVVLNQNPRNLRQGQVVSGGTINLSGNIVAERGALFDVSGTRGVLDLNPSAGSLAQVGPATIGGVKQVPVAIDSNGGRISLSGSRMLYSDATLVGLAGGPSAVGGTLNVSSGRFSVVGAPTNTAEASLVVRQSGQLVPTGFVDGVLGKQLVDPGGTALPGIGNFTVSTFAGGGFDSLSLTGNLDFSGDVSLNVPGSLRLASGGVIYGKGQVQLSAGYIAAGQSFRSPVLPTQDVTLFTQTDSSGNTTRYQFSPSYGTGLLALSADLVDLGDLSLDGIGFARIAALNGDIRGNGTFQMRGDLTLQAGQIYPTTQRQFSLFVYDPSVSRLGSVTVLPSAPRNLPYSAGGTLSIQASSITQAGALRAPSGIINLGWDGSGTAPFNPIAGSFATTPVTSLLTLAAGGVTSVSNIDPITGKALSLPYGISLDGTSWIDPAGNDITVTGPPVKSVKLAATNLITEQGSFVDIRGGGDLYAYRWVSGNGGTEDILDSSGSFAVIPGYGFNYSPFAPFNTDSSATNLEGQAGYVNSTLKAGDQITVAASRNLAAGTYTLLPARYALLPGAVLVTPKSKIPANTSVTTASGASMVSGYRANNLNPARTGATVISGFEIAPAPVVRQRAEYIDLLANTTLREAAVSREFAVPRLPMDAGYLSFTSTASMSLRGSVSSISSAGRGGLIDINSSSDILINSSGTGGSGGLVLNAGILNSFGAESLLIGGLRSVNANGAQVAVNSSNVTLDNAGTPLFGKDIILVSREKLTLAENSEIFSPDDTLALDPLTLGDPAVPGSGDGTLVRVSANASGRVSRAGLSASTLPQLDVLPGSVLAGGSIVLDSTAGTTLAESARLLADDVSLNSGRISVALNNPGLLNPASGLVLGGEALANLQSNTKRLSLLSYSSIDTYGTGIIGSRSFENLSLQAAAIRGFNTGGGGVTFSAASISLGNRAASVPLPALVGPLAGSLAFDADRITLGANALQLEGFAQNDLVAAGILTESTGSLDSTGDLRLVTPLLTGAGASKYQIRSERSLQVSRPATSLPVSLNSGFGAELSLQGATASIDSDILLPSGKLTLRSTSGDLVIAGTAPANLLLAGTSKTFVDVIRYTSGGTVNLFSDTGSVRLGSAAAIDVSAPVGGGDAGTIAVTAPQGVFVLNGSIAGNSGTNGETGSFALDVASVANESLASLDGILNAGNFTLSRDYRIRSGNVLIDGPATARTYRVAADSGNILVSSTINASGLTGGSIDLKANGSLTLLGGSKLDASAVEFDSAGKGGSVVLEAGNQRNGVINAAASLDLRTGSAIDLSVAAAAANSQSLGMFTGTLHLRAPRNAANNDLAVAAIGGTITGASHVLVEGVKLYGLTGVGTITTTLQNSIRSEGESFLGAAGTTTAGYSAMLGRLTALNPGLDLILAPGAEIYNLNGSLTLGASNSTVSSDWNLSSFRFGPRSTAGVLTLRASENLTFFNALSDGFSGGSSLWLAPLNPFNPLLPANVQSWSLRMAAGADLSAASFREVRTLESLPVTAGFFELGKNAGAAIIPAGGAGAQTSSVIGNFFQVIRTGSGNIDIHAGRDLRLLNPFASVYTAGTSVAVPTSVLGANDFVVPILNRNVDQGNLGSAQQNYLAQYSMAGGNVTLSAGGNIERKTRNGSGLIDDSSRQLPGNWLYRRGYVDDSGVFGRIRIGSGFGSTSDPAASTTWWVDFSNFFQSVGALGGGNIELTAGQDVMNVDAAIPTNARAARGIPSADGLIELGGGDLRVTAGRDISGGVYYVERGQGTLNAGGAITTNATRSPSFGLVGNLNNPASAQLDSRTWMPTTLFVGKSSFDLTAGSDLLLGPIGNPFLLPQGIGNRFWYKSHFSTVTPDSRVSALSLGGDVTFRNAVTLPSSTQAIPMLRAWHETQLLFTGSSGSTAWFQPWLRLAETNVAAFSPVLALSAASFDLTSFSGNLNLAGELTVFPSPNGQLELLAAGSINALQPTGLSRQATGQFLQNWTASSINLSDADPAAVPGGFNPLTSSTSSPTGAIVSNNTVPGFMNSLAALFVESGSVTGSDAVLQTRQARHTLGGLRGGDSQPLRIYALGGDLSGLTLFSGKQAKISASNDISDVAFYIQNNGTADVTTITAGRDITAFDSTSSLRVASLSSGNRLSSGQSPLAGDIQISGPGVLQVFAGRDLDLGIGSNNADGTGTGITSVGNLRNPFLPEKGAGIVVGAGIGSATSLSTSSLAFQAFVAKYVNTDQGRAYLAEIAPGVDFESQSGEEQALLALEVFYLILRDTGRDFNDSNSPGFGNYDTGFDAIATLFPEAIGWNGQLLTQSRNIRTRSGGDIRIFVPGGGLAMADTTIGNPLTPPGLVTESGGSISIFTDQSVDIGIGRIFTLRGGDVSIWSSKGDIAAGSSSRTVSAAPPTRVVIDPQSASVQTDLAGLATGGGIGVLATVEGVAPGDVDLIAPAGIIDAGDAGIRVSGNINLAAVSVVNAGNISASGSSTGTPTATASAPSVTAVTSASNATAATTSTAVNAGENQRAPDTNVDAAETPSLYTVEVIGYGGGGAEEDEDEEERLRRAAEEAGSP
jgi:filamentous hemagglutinin family protein